MKRKLAFIAAAALLMTAGCGKINDPAAETEENTTVTEAETTTAEETSETAVETTAEPTAAAPETTSEAPAENKAAAGINVLSELRTGMTEDEVFSIIGENYDYKSDVRCNSMEYDYSFASDEVFGTGLSGYMFAEFDSESKQLICCGYHIGAVGNVDESEHPYGEDKLAAGYAKVIEKLTADYGDGQRPIEYSGEGIKDEISWSDGSDQLWAIYGTDLWGKESGVNEMIVSRSIER